MCQLLCIGAGRLKKEMLGPVTATLYFSGVTNGRKSNVWLRNYTQVVTGLLGMSWDVAVLRMIVGNSWDQIMTSLYLCCVTNGRKGSA